MTVRELAKLAQHIIKTIGQLQDLWRTRVHLEQSAPAKPQSAACHGHRRRRHEDRLHQGGGLWLVGSAVSNNLRLILVVNGFKTMKDRAEESRKLLEWGFRAFETERCLRR